MKLLDALEKACPSMNPTDSKGRELGKARFKSLNPVIASDFLVLL